MALGTTQIVAEETQSAGDRAVGRGQLPQTERRVRWLRRPWVGPLAVLAAGFLGVSLPRYLSFDRSRSLVRLDPRFALHYPFVIGHVLFGSVALVGVCLQVWPWLRLHHPTVHRRVGRLYVFAGVFPAGLLALSIMPFSHGPTGNAVAAILWLTTTAIGWRTGRQRRYAEHRRWMIYSFALTLQIMWGRVLFVLLPVLPNYNPNDQHTMTQVFDTASWIGVVINLIAAQCWLEWTARRAARTGDQDAVMTL